MPKTVTDGTLVFRTGLELPLKCGIEVEFFSHGWQRVVNFHSYDLDRALQKADWTFRYSCPKQRAVAFGFGRKDTAMRAFNKMVAAVNNKSYNCLELSGESIASFLGFTRVQLTGHPRTIEERYAIRPMEAQTPNGAAK
jgi:hypothetical protein